MDRKGHSGLGIASFVFGSFSLISFFFTLIALVIEAQTPIIGLFGVLNIILSLFGAGCGIPGLFSQSNKRVFPLLGTIFSVSTLITITSLMLIGAYLGK